MKSVSGSFYVLKGYRLLLDKNYRIYALVPILLNSVLFIGFYIGLYFSFEHAGELFNFKAPSWLPDWMGSLSWIATLLYWIMVVGIAMVFSFVFATLASLITIILSAPVLSLLVEKILCHSLSLPSHSVKQLVLGALSRELTKGLYFVPRALGVGLFGLVLFVLPGLKVLSSLLFFVFGSWMLSLENLDFVNEALGQSFKNTRDTVKQKRLLCFSYGVGTMISTMIPLVNFFSIPANLAGGTLLWLDHFSNPNKANQL